MDSFLSGFSHNYSGTQVGQGYTGNVGTTGNIPANGNQSVDVTQLQSGDTFQGEIASVNGEDVQIQLANGQYMTAKLERDVQVALGQVMNLQVQSNKDNRIVLKPVYDGRAQMLRVGEAALRAASMAVNDKNLTLVSKLIENGLSIDKNTLMTFNRLALQNPNVDMAEIIKLNKMQLPVNNNTLTQLQNYQNMEHRLLDGIREASDEILKLYDALSKEQGSYENNQGLQGNPDTAANQGTAAGQAALENSGRFMEQVLVMLSGEDGWNETVTVNSGNSVLERQNVQADSNPDTREVSGEKEPPVPAEADRQAAVQPKDSTDVKAAPQENKTADAVINQLKGEKVQALSNKIITLIKDGQLDIKGMKQLLVDSDLGKMLTTGQKAAIFGSEPFKSMLKNGLQKQWTLTPQDLTQDGKIEEFYQKLMKESSRLSQMMNEAMQADGHNAGGTQARAMSNISENLEFMNHINQVFSYIQLPLKFGNTQAHGDLYVYTNKRNMARRDGMLTAFLHLDMDHLGALDVSITLQTEKNQVTTKFYLDEDAIPLVEENIGELTQSLLKKGYQCKNLVVEKEEDKTVIEHIEEQMAGGNAVLSYQTFDTRA